MLRAYGTPDVDKRGKVAEFSPLEACRGLPVKGRFTSTIHAINSGILKLSRIQPATCVYRGASKLMLPKAMRKRNSHQVRGGVEYGFMSTTLNARVAHGYATGDTHAPSTLFEAQMGMVDRGAQLDWLSQYPHEKEILLPPLTAIEVTSIETLAEEKVLGAIETARQLERAEQRREFLMLDKDASDEQCDAAEARRRVNQIKQLGIQLDELQQRQAKLFTRHSSEHIEFERSKNERDIIRLETKILDLQSPSSPGSNAGLPGFSPVSGNVGINPRSRSGTPALIRKVQLIKTRLNCNMMSVTLEKLLQHRKKQVQELVDVVKKDFEQTGKDADMRSRDNERKELTSLIETDVAEQFNDNAYLTEKMREVLDLLPTVCLPLGPL